MLPAATTVRLPPYNFPSLSFLLPFSACRQRLLQPSAAVGGPPATNPYHPSFRYQNPTPAVSTEAPPLPSPSLTIGDCLVFEEDAFEDGVASEASDDVGRPKARSSSESLVPSKWKDLVEEINVSKKDKRKIAHEVKYGTRVNRLKPRPVVDLEAYRAYREEKLSQLNPIVLDDPVDLIPDKEPPTAPPPGRAQPKNPREEIVLGSIDDIVELFSDGNYVPGGATSDNDLKGRRKLFKIEEKKLLNRHIPNLDIASSSKWLPLHSIAASGEYDLLVRLLKHDVDINAVDKDGVSAIHKAILSNKQAIFNLLLKNSANPSICDKDGATLMHYAVHAASGQIIKILLLYDVDINRADNYGWTPLHVAVQTRRTDVVKLLLRKGADRNLKNCDGLTPLELCLHMGKDVRTYEVVKLLKDFQLPPEMPEYA